MNNMQMMMKLKNMMGMLSFLIGHLTKFFIVPGGHDCNRLSTDYLLLTDLLVLNPFFLYAMN